jgi:hypothetical protein
MGSWIGAALLVVHTCGAIYGLMWAGDVAEFHPAQLIGGRYWLGDAVTKCTCGCNVLPFRSKQWTEL